MVLVIPGQEVWEQKLLRVCIKDGEKMRRIENLQNAIYKTKYRELYKLIFTADIDRIADHSNWLHRGEKNYVEINRPLWIVMESKKINKRIWISHEWGKLRIDTAQLDLDVDSKEYHDSYQRYSFSNQRDLCNKLKELLEPCLELEQKQEIEEEIEMGR